MSRVTEIRYVGYAVPDLAAEWSFYVEKWGLKLVREQAGMAYLATEGYNELFSVRLRARDIPCGQVNRIEDLSSNAHLAAVGVFRTVEHPEEGPLLEVRSPFRVLGEEESPDAPAPRPGGDGGAVLREAGFSEDEIAALVDSGALRRRSTREKT